MSLNYKICTVLLIQLKKCTTFSLKIKQCLIIELTAFNWFVRLNKNNNYSIKHRL